MIPLIEISENVTNRLCKIYKPRRNEVERNFRKLYRFNPENVNFLFENLVPIYEETWWCGFKFTKNEMFSSLRRRSWFSDNFTEYDYKTKKNECLTLKLITFQRLVMGKICTHVVIKKPTGIFLNLK